MVAGLVYIFSTKSTYVFINFIDYSRYIYTFLSHGAVLCVYVCVQLYKMFMNVFKP